MVGAIQSVTTGTDSTSQVAEAVSVMVLRKSLDNELNVAQQMVTMVAQSSVYSANAQVLETPQRMLDIVV